MILVSFHLNSLFSAQKKISCLLSCVLLAIAFSLLPDHSEPAQARETQKFVTPGGISVWLVEDHGIPIVSMRFAIRGGSVGDPAGKEGAGNLLANLMEEGAGSLDTEAFKDKLEALGSRLSFSISRVAFTGSITTLKRNLDETAELMRLALQDPNLNADDFDKSKREELASIAINSRNSTRVAVRAFDEIAFVGHPYAKPPKGTEASLSTLSVEDVRARHEKLITKTGLHVVIVGAVDAETATQIVDRTFSGLPVLAEKPEVEPAPFKTFEKTLPALPGERQEIALFALPMPGFDDQDFYPATALNHILGSGNFDARLTEEIRVKRGLTYAISSQLVTDRVSSMALGLVSTEAGKMDEAIAVIKSVLSQMQAEGPTASELENAKNGLNGAYLLDLDTSSRLGAHMIGLWLDRLDPDYVALRREGLNAVTLDNAKRVAKSLYDIDKLSLLIMRPGATQ